MKINKKRIISADHIMDKIPANIDFKIVKSINKNDFILISKIGFKSNLKSGDKILPNVIGSVSKFNVFGKYKPLKYLPKEQRYLYTFYWSWTEYHGDTEVEQSDFKDIYRMCYQREFTPPPSIELIYVEDDKQSYIISETLINYPTNYELIKNTINLFLEIFGDCELKYSDLRDITPPITKKVNWEMLPHGEYPWVREKSYVHQKLSRTTPLRREPVIIRQNQLNSFYPDDIYEGIGGFRNYIAYVFKEAGITVLEGIENDNATYVFDLNWEQTSQLTKAQILQNNLQKARIYHTEGWLTRLSKEFPPFHKIKSA